MLEFIKQKKNLIIAITVVIICIVYWIYNKNTSYNESNLESNILEVASNTDDKDNKDTDENIIMVHIIGGVAKPGVVKIKEGGRIEDAIEAAGGLTEDSDISNVNLAYVLDDGVKVKIPTIDDESKETEETYISEDSGKNVILQEDEKVGSIVNINKATQTELETLPGIGPSLADRIISYREQNGKFKKIEDIKNVAGIGDSKFENIKDFIKVK